MIFVVATIELRDGSREEFLNFFRGNVPNVVAEDGCIEYIPVVDVPTDIPAQGPARGNVVMVIEKWRDLSALKAHLVAPHMEAYRAQVKSMVVGASLQIVEPASD